MAIYYHYSESVIFYLFLYKNKYFFCFKLNYAVYSSKFVKFFKNIVPLNRFKIAIYLQILLATFDF